MNSREEEEAIIHCPCCVDWKNKLKTLTSENERIEKIRDELYKEIHYFRDERCPQLEKENADLKRRVEEIAKEEFRIREILRTTSIRNGELTALCGKLNEALDAVSRHCDSPDSHCKDVANIAKLAIADGGESDGRNEMKLSERRAIFVYEAARVENYYANRPINPEPWEDRDEKFQKNMIKAVARQCGKGRLTSPKKLHDAWVVAYEKMGWKYGRIRDVEAKTHPDMVPFHKLGRLEQEKDWVFFMLCEIARKIK